MSESVKPIATRAQIPVNVMVECRQGRVGQWVEDRAEARGQPKVLGDPTIQRVGDARNDEDDERQGIVLIAQQQDQNRRQADARECN